MYSTQVAWLYNMRVKSPVEILNQVANPTRCRNPLNSVVLWVRYTVQRLHKDVFTPILCKGGVPATCVMILNDTMCR